MEKPRDHAVNLKSRDLFEMKRAKGLSFDEKRARMNAIFHETKDFFTFKELEKMGPKMKGIVAQSVKEVLDSLVSDNLVICEKIGTSNYYWSFPSTALVTRQTKLAQLQEERDRLKEQIAETEQRIHEGTAGREDTTDRVQLLETLAQVEKLRRDRLEELQMYKDNDPVMLKAKEKAAKVAKQAANRWTDNVFSIQSYCAQNFGIDAETFAQQFDVKPDFDTLP